MNGACGTADPDALIRSLIGMADCQTAALGGDGWHGLAGSGLFAALLTGLLTLAIVREGYRLLAGGGGTATAVPPLLIRFGLVIALSTSWQAYDRLIYRVAMEGPGEVAALILPAAGIETRALAGRLQNAYDAIEREPVPVEPRGGVPPGSPTRGPANGAHSEMISAAPVASLPGFDRHGAAGVLAIMGAGSWIAARFVLGLLLAIGPMAVVALLFDNAAGLTIGWLRALLGAALACLVIPLSLSAELQALAGPVAAATDAGTLAVPGVGPIIWIFVLVDLALIAAVQRVAGGITLPLQRLRLPGHAGTSAVERTTVLSTEPGRTSARPATIVLAPTAPSRASVIARAAESRIAPPVKHIATAITASTRIAAAPPSAATMPIRGTQMIDRARRTAAGRRAFSGQRHGTPS